MWEYNQAPNITFKVYLGLCHSTKKKQFADFSCQIVTDSLPHCDQKELFLTLSGLHM